MKQQEHYEAHERGEDCSESERNCTFRKTEDHRTFFHKIDDWMWYNEHDLFKYQATLTIIDAFRIRLESVFSLFSCLPTFAIMWRSLAGIASLLIWM